MMRKKLNLSYITNDSVRKTTFNKRKKGFVKKIHELSVLCGIEACAIIYSPFNSSPEVWPSNLGVENVVEKFKMMTEMEQEKKMVNHEEFLRQNISKIVENNNKKMKENMEMTMKEAMFQLLSGNEKKLTLNDRNREDLCKYIDQYLNELYHHKNEILNQSHLEYGESSSATNAVVPTSIVEVSSCSFPNLDVFNSSRLTDDSWFLRPIISSTAADQHDYYPVINPVGVYGQNQNLNHCNHNQYQYQQHVGYPILAQDGIYNPNQNQQEERLVDHLMNYPETLSIPLMDGNNCYYHQQP